MKKSKINHYFNRELSWLEFNQRVLDEAAKKEVPVLERLKFLSITASNLDEFYMVRVGGLRILAEQGIIKGDPAGLSPQAQLEKISRRVALMVKRQHRLYIDELEPLLAKQGIVHMSPELLSADQRRQLSDYFDNDVFPVITPIPDTQPMPFLTNLQRYLMIRLDHANPKTDTRYVYIPVSPVLERFIPLSGDHRFQYIMIDEVIRLFINRFFLGASVGECALFRITRNADLTVQEEQSIDLLSQMRNIIDARKQSACIRLEVESTISKVALLHLQKSLGINSTETVRQSLPMDFGSFLSLASMDRFPELHWPAWPPVLPPSAKKTESMFDLIRRQSLLLVHPYESFDPVVRMVNEAAEDPSVLAIKQTLYRTGRRSAIVAGLQRAAENGKQVTAIVELKARFDEERNIDWARKLEYAGVQVIYGIKGLKTHAKICIIVRREGGRIARYIHFGTGNYNENTARLYSDISFFSCDDDLGSDASTFFNAITGFSQAPRFLKIDAAPLSLRERLIKLIDGEIIRASQNRTGLIMAKMNSLADPQLIEKLYDASKAGVKILLNVRGICCLRPGIPGLSENISVISIIDRFLEHSRIFYFYHDGDEKVFISSADWMPRNLDRRIELLVPVDDDSCRRELVELLRITFLDNKNCHILTSEGDYRRQIKSGSTVRSQEELYHRVATRSRQKQPITFEPHRPRNRGVTR